MAFCLTLDTRTLHITPPRAPKGYIFLSFAGPNVPQHYITQCVSLTGRKWQVRANSHVLFLTHNDQVVAIRYFQVDQDANTAEGYAAFTQKGHREKGLWKYLLLKFLIIAQEKGIATVIATTEKQFLWPFFLSLGFKKGTRDE